MNDKTDKRERAKKIIKRTLIILLLLFVCASAYLVWYLYNDAETHSEYRDLLVTLQNGEAEKPIDFEELQKTNDEIYAWLKVDGTKVDYPVVQSATDDEFYLKHSAVDKSWIASGAIYTESCNNKDFKDPITLVYGHNGYSDIMFTTLHNFEDKDFFDSHEYFYVYLPDRKLTYQVVSAFKYDDRHIMNTFNFADEEDLAEFQATVQNPSSSLRQVRTDLDVTIDKDSKIIVLSTCITGQKSNRYLVCGVLVDDKKMK